jgi:transposase-like protein
LGAAELDFVTEKSGIVNIKSRTSVMRSSKQFRNAAITLAGVELMHRLRKGQFSLAQLSLEDITVPVVWNVLLSDQ